MTRAGEAAAAGEDATDDEGQDGEKEGEEASSKREREEYATIEADVEALEIAAAEAQQARPGPVHSPEPNPRPCAIITAFAGEPGDYPRLPGRGSLERRRSGRGDCPGPQNRTRSHDGVDERRGAALNHCRTAGRILVAFSQRAVAQGRNLGARTAAAQSAPGL